MPVYNAEKHLRVSVGSVLAQTHGDFELICVDDGSTDASGTILDGVAARDARVRVIHQANGGEGAARNAGLDAATGDLVAFLDADDTLHPDGLALFAAAWQKTAADVMRYGWTAVTEHRGATRPLPGLDCVREVDLAARTESVVRFCALGCATVISRAACGDVRFCSLPQGADMIFVLDCLLRSRKTVFIDAPVLQYLVHSGSVSQRLSTGLMTGTCGYIPELVDRCARLDVRPEAVADMRRYMCDLLFRRLAGAWRLFPAAADREPVRQAFWATLRGLVARDGFFGPLRRKAVAAACRAESLPLLLALAVLPYRVERKFVR